MSYDKAAPEKKYQQPQPPGLKGKPGAKPKGAFEREMVDKASDAALKNTKGSE